MIVTVTMNPAIDISTSVEEVVPFRKLRCTAIRRDPGGGGINVARVVRRFGGDVVAVYPSGGTIGTLLERLIAQEDIRSHAIPVREDTREDFTAFERATGHEFRFVLPGPRLTEAEWMRCLEAVHLAGATPTFVVLSGSLPPGVPAHFYVRAAQIARQRGARVVADTSGPPLRALLEEGIYLAKPNRRELEDHAGTPLTDENAQVAAARTLVQQGQAEIVALTRGPQGGILVTNERAWRAHAPAVTPVSTVGAGDSFLGAMLVRLDRGAGLEDAFRHGIAAGSAALMSPGTELCRPEEAARLLPQVRLEPI